MSKETYRVVIEYRSVATGRTWYQTAEGLNRLATKRVHNAVGTVVNGVECISAESYVS